jgi:plastocyanin
MLASLREVRRLCTAGVLALAVTALGGCGGGDDENPEEPGGGAPAPAPTGGGGTLQLKAVASGQLRFDPETLRADAGKVTLVMDNPATLPHNVAIEGPGVDEVGEVVQKGGKSRVTATLRAGKYTFYCSVPGHREGGMVGTLTVR